MTVFLLALLWLSPQVPKKKPVHHKPSHKVVAPHTGMAPERAAEIQAALVKAGYLDRGSGHWDDATAAAMRKYQRDHHWQEKFVPDSRALIALGLGPSRDSASLIPTPKP